MTKHWLTGVLASAILLCASSAQATALNLIPALPDFTLSNDQNLSYDSGTGVLTISGGTIAGYEDENNFLWNVGSPESFTLTVTLDGSGNVLSGSFTLDGIVRLSGPPFTILYDGGTDVDGLITGQLTQFGWAGTGQNSGIIEMTWNTGDGIISDIYGSTGGMILSVNTGSGGSASFKGGKTFDANLLSDDWSGTAFGDVFVPVPAAVWLFGSALAGLMGFGRRREAARSR